LFRLRVDNFGAESFAPTFLAACETPKRPDERQIRPAWSKRARRVHAFAIIEDSDGLDQ
jgi:hypothetical protein